MSYCYDFKSKCVQGEQMIGLLFLKPNLAYHILSRNLRRGEEVHLYFNHRSRTGREQLYYAILFIRNSNRGERGTSKQFTKQLASNTRALDSKFKSYQTFNRNATRYGKHFSKIFGLISLRNE